MVLNRWGATHFWVAGTYFWVAKTCVIVLLYLCLGRQIVHYSVLWVANYQTLRTTGLDHCFLTWSVCHKLKKVEKHYLGL